MNKLFILFFTIFVMNSVQANDMQSILNQTLAQSDALKKDSYKHMKNFNPNTVFDHYSSHPNQTQYYDGVMQSNTSKLNQDAMNAPSSTTAGSTVSNSINKHPNFVINQNDADMSHSRFIENNADDIIHGVTNRYVDCQSPQICKTTYQQKECEEAPENIYQSCKKTLNIDIFPHEVVTHYTLVAHVKTKERHFAEINVNTVTGNINYRDPREVKFTLEGRMPLNINCNGLQGSVTQQDDHGRRTRIDNITFPNCSNGMVLDFHLTSHKKIKFDMQIDIVSKVITYETKDRWIDNCNGLSHEPTCMFKSKVCNQPNETRNFNGISVRRDCWEETYHYICHGGNGAGNCQPLHAQGCEQINSVCKEQKNNQCALYHRTYQCPVQSCSNSSNIFCGDGKSYCLDGNCVDHSYNQSKDFARGISALSSVADASKQFDPNSLTIFSGYSAECSEKPIGFSNCCTEKGWGQDTGLAHCPQDAKKLHEAREKGVTVKIGRYCSGSEPFPCLEHSQVFCVFNSKLAKIIQEQGRKDQLQMGFGSAKHPNCMGITPDQLKSIDLGKIDFQEFYADIHAKTPDLNQIQQTIEQRIKKIQDAG